VFSGVSEHIEDCPTKLVAHAENIPVRSQVIFDVEHPEFTLKFTNLAKGVVAMITLQTQRAASTQGRPSQLISIW
jgi:hypothetical protein